MKNINLILIILVAVMPEAFSQTPEVIPDNTIQPGSPKIGFPVTEFDFGTIKSGSEAVHYFVFYNRGSFPLAISNIRTSCGCAVPAWPKAPLAAGAKDSLRVEYNTRVKGVFDKTITVYTNDPGGISELRIRGNVVKAR